MGLAAQMARLAGAEYRKTPATCLCLRDDPKKSDVGALVNEDVIAPVQKDRIVKPMSPTDDLIACPECDALYHVDVPKSGERAVCSRCHTVLISPRRGAGLKVIALSIASLILITTALTHPFISISRFGLSHGTTIIQAALAYSGPYILVSLAVFSLIILIPLLRMLLILYVLIPLVRDKPPWRNAKAAFQMSETLKPWSMAEVFVIGCAVALVKIAGLAHVELGMAFWLFTVFCLLVVIQDTLMCRWSIWKALDQ